MRTSFFIAADITWLLTVSQATSISADDVVIPRDVQLISPDSDIFVRNLTEYNTTSLAAVFNLAASIPQTAVVVIVIYSNVQVVSGACVASVSTGPGQSVSRPVCRSLQCAAGESIQAPDSFGGFAAQGTSQLVSVSYSDDKEGVLKYLCYGSPCFFRHI
jgi:hypothetical protein